MGGAPILFSYEGWTLYGASQQSELFYFLEWFVRFRVKYFETSDRALPKRRTADRQLQFAGTAFLSLGGDARRALQDRIEKLSASKAAIKLPKVRRPSG
jgi:hypothetical protein